MTAWGNIDEHDGVKHKDRKQGIRTHLSTRYTHTEGDTEGMDMRGNPITKPKQNNSGNTERSLGITK